LFTDEPSNGDRDYSYATIDALIKSNNALYNTVIANFCSSSSCNLLRDLATNNGGNAFSLDALNTTDQTVVENFVTDFANVKLQETVDFCQVNPQDPACVNIELPSPGTLSLMIGALLLACRKRFS
jgi:hypothetical protein